MTQSKSQSVKIHPTSFISSDTQLDVDVEIGPYTVIQGQVQIGKGTIIEGHVSIGSRSGIVKIGEKNHIFPGAAVGGPPQDLSYKGDATQLVIGNGNTIREFTTLNIASTKHQCVTRIGNNNYLMAYTHVGHDCQLGSNITMANNSILGGHVEIEDNVVISAMCGVNQFCKIGKFSFLAAGSEVNKDVLPFSKAHGKFAVMRGTNKIGLQRNGYSMEEVSNVHRAIRIIVMGTETVEQAIDRISTECNLSPNIEYLINFIRHSNRGIAR